MIFNTHPSALKEIRRRTETACDLKHGGGNIMAWARMADPCICWCCDCWYKKQDEFWNVQGFTFWLLFQILQNRQKLWKIGYYLKTKSQPSDACLVTVDKTECRLKAAAVKARQNTLKEIWHLMMSIDRSFQAVIDCKGFLSNIEKKIFI